MERTNLPPAADAALRAQLVPWDQLPDLGLYMDQVITYLERMFAPMRPPAAERLITSAMINNYVKAGLVPRPVGKKYERAHLAALVMVTALKPAMRMDAIARLLRAPSAPEDIRARYEAFVRAHAAVRRIVAEQLPAGDGTADALRLALAASVCCVVSEALQGAPCTEKKQNPEK